MIYSVEKEVDYEGCEIILASDSLQICIDAVNNHKYWPYVGDGIIFRVWNDNKMIASAYIIGNRQEDSWKGTPGPISYEEVMENMKVVK